MESRQDVDLRLFNTFRISVKAAKYFEINNEDDLQIALDQSVQPINILGGGSNVLLTGDVQGSLFHINIKGINVVDQDDEGELIRVGAGEVWHDLVIWSVEHGYYGLENLSLIPGKVGAAPIQNIGAYGIEQESVFVALEAIELKTRTLQVFSHAECLFGYRDSFFKNEGKGKYCITAVYYRLKKEGHLTLGYGAVNDALENRETHNPTPSDVSEVIISIRQSKLPDPKVIGNGGSFFKNPILPMEVIEILQKEHEALPSYPVADHPELLKTSAAWLIDQCGWKGKKVGESGTYKNHALVLVNHGNATGNDIWNVAQSIIKDVKDRFDIELEPEVNVW